MSDPKELAFINYLRIKRELDTCIVTILSSFFCRNVLLFSVLEKDRVGEHSIIDGDCDTLKAILGEKLFVGEHSIIDGDCDAKFHLRMQALECRRAFHN